jgi:hypothetical protein
MKKLVLIIVVIFALGMTTTSCKKEKVEEKKQMATEVYQCPMDCEKGKTYSKPGNCPVCKMALKAKKPGEKAADKHEHKEGDDHKH